MKTHSLLIFFLRRGHTMNQTTRAVTRAQPSEMLSVPHHGTRSKPSTAHMRQRRHHNSDQKLTFSPPQLSKTANGCSGKQLEKMTSVVWDPVHS